MEVCTDGAATAMQLRTSQQFTKDSTTVIAGTQESVEPAVCRPQAEVEQAVSWCKGKTYMVAYTYVV